MDAFSELKGLADTADGIISKAGNRNNRLEEWFSLFTQAAVDIVSNKKVTSEDSASNDETKNAKKLPDIVPFVSEPEIVVKEKQRISVALACLQMQKDHILHVKRNTPVKDLPCETRNKSPEQHKAVCNETFVKFTTPDNNVETSDNDSRNEKSINSVNGEDKQEFFTPVGQNPEISELQSKTGRASRKRKSSSPFFNTVSVKKVKVLNSETVSIQKKSIRKSLRVQHAKISDIKFLKYHNRLPSAKISGSGINTSVLKENRGVRKKSETEDNQTLKKVLAARQIKAQEAKRKREEKMLKISQQRLKLEKEKDERLRSRKPKEVEKTLLKTVLDSKKKRTREVEKNQNSEVLSEPPSAKKTRSKNTGTPIKTPRKRTTVEKENKIEKTQDIERKYNSEVKSDLPSTKDTKLGKASTPRKPSRKKDTKIKAEEIKNENEDFNKTYLAKASIPTIKEIGSTVPKLVSPTKGDVFKTPVPPQRTISSSATAHGSTTVTKSNVGKSTPLAAKQKQSNNSTLATSTNTQSYEMTPARRSSFVNYDVSEIKSDDSDDDEDSKRNPKPVPGWASGVRLKNALVQQQYHPIDTDVLFGNVFDTPNLVEIMGIKSKRYFKRTSSAVWNSPSAFM